MKWLKDGLSIDEFKLSTLILAHLAVLTCSLIIYFLTGDISDNLLTLNETLIYSIAGVNAVNGFASIVKKKVSKQSEEYMIDNEVNVKKDDEPFNI